MRTLYLTDLDGTLLRPDQRTGAYTNEVINRLVERGMIFSYATARSFVTASRVTAGLRAIFPMIAYNGSFIIENPTGRRLAGNLLPTGDVRRIDALLRSAGIVPIVYTFESGREQFRYCPKLLTDGGRAFVDSRRGDPRKTPVSDRGSLTVGEVFYFTCIGEESELEPLRDALKDDFHCVYHIDLYTKMPWLEIMPKNATKANAALQLKQMLGCDRIVAFGDGANDIELFEIADECYAVANAVPELKALATDVIGSNEDEGVARFLAGRF